MLSKVALIALALVATTEAFLSVPHRRRSLVPSVAGKKDKSEDGETVQQKQQVAMGSICEFDDSKGHEFIGKITNCEHKANGNNRYDLETLEGKLFNVAEKQLHFIAPPPANPKEHTRLFKEIDASHMASVADLTKSLDLDPEVLELAWEESSSELEGMLATDTFVELVHSRKPIDSVEAYRAWRFLMTDLGTVFFKSIKENGRVMAFKAKTEAAVEAAKTMFCKDEKIQKQYHFCLV